MDHRTYDNHHHQEPSSLPHLHKVKASFGDSLSVELEHDLSSLMNDCAVNHIEAGKNWVFKNCQRPEQCTVVLDYINQLAGSSPRFSHRLHLVYLINDILHHAIRRQLIWMKHAFLSRLSTLLYLTYSIGNSPEQQYKVLKVINLWEEKRFFNTDIIQHLRHEINHGPSMALQSSVYGTARSFENPQNNTKPYHQLQAGLMTVALKIDQPPYTPIDPHSIREKPPQQRLDPSKEMLNVVDDFYAGLKLDHVKSSMATIGKEAVFTIGWEPHFLDSFYQKFQSQQQQRLLQQTTRHSPRKRENSPDSPKRRDVSRSRHSRSPRKSDSHHHSKEYRPTTDERHSMNTGSTRMGLGASSNVFDEFRKRSSYNFTKEVSRRDPAAGPKCYNCGKYGHFAKTCEAHLGKS